MTIAGSADLRVGDFLYELPVDRIAQTPLPDRDASRMLVVDGLALRDGHVRDLAAELRPGDLVVGNHTRVRAARLRGTRAGGAAAELLILDRIGVDRVICLVRPARKLPSGSVVELRGGMRAEIEGSAPGHPGARFARIDASAVDAADVDAAIERIGETPLPPYITSALDDPGRYQTVFAQGEPRSAAAPTAGLHITAEVVAALASRGIGFTTVDLEVGLATFAPMTADRIADHAMHEERFRVPPDAALRITESRAKGGRIIALGTTVVRVLETAASDGQVRAGEGVTRLFIRPGHRFTVVDGLVTNFHQPGSSLLVLVAALIGMARWREIYAHAMTSDYRFLSFGDCMLLLPTK